VSAVQGNQPADGNPDDGEVTLDELKTYCTKYAWGDLMDTQLPLRYLQGTATFNGVNPHFVTSDDFDGGFDVKIIGDIDTDGDVDFSDFSIFSSNWQAVGCDPNNNWCQQADLDLSGNVDPNDLSIFTGNWLKGADDD